MRSMALDHPPHIPLAHACLLRAGPSSRIVHAMVAHLLLCGRVGSRPTGVLGARAMAWHRLPHIAFARRCLLRGEPSSCTAHGGQWCCLSAADSDPDSRRHRCAQGALDGIASPAGRRVCLRSFAACDAVTMLRTCDDDVPPAVRPAWLTAAPGCWRARDGTAPFGPRHPCVCLLAAVWSRRHVLCIRRRLISCRGVGSWLTAPSAHGLGIRARWHYVTRHTSYLRVIACSRVESSSRFVHAMAVHLLPLILAGDCLLPCKAVITLCTCMAAHFLP